MIKLFLFSFLLLVTVVVSEVVLELDVVLVDEVELVLLVLLVEVVVATFRRIDSSS